MLLALALLALVALSSGPVHATASQAARHAHAHRAVALRRRDGAPSTGRCIPRPSSALPTSTSLPPSSALPTSTTPSTTSLAPSPTTTTPPKGCYALGTDPSFLENFSFSRVKYVYNWSPVEPSPLPSGLSFMPMLWGADQEATFAETVVEGYASVALGFNEPNELSQSNLSPSQAFDIWMKYINPLKPEGYLLVSPACTNDEPGMEWYTQFFALCTPEANCHVDILAVHAYTTSAEDVINYVTQLHSAFNLPIAITEIADQNFSGTGGQASMDEIWDFAGRIVRFTTTTDWIHIVCPFGLLTDISTTGVNALNALMTPDGYPTPLAYFYFDNL